MTDEPRISKAELLEKMDHAWQALRAFVDPLSEEALTGPKDAVGWNIRDHLMHLVVWQDGVRELLSGTPRWRSMGLDPELWSGRDYDRINAVIQERYVGQSGADAIRALTESHDRLLARLREMPEADLYKPYRSFQPDSDREEPIIGWIIGNSFEHYEEHLPWMAQIHAAPPHTA